jgi:hypothetical protein
MSWKCQPRDARNDPAQPGPGSFEYTEAAPKVAPAPDSLRPKESQVTRSKQTIDVSLTRHFDARLFAPERRARPHMGLRNSAYPWPLPFRAKPLARHGLFPTPSRP